MSRAEALMSVIASMVIFTGGVAALVRALWKAAQVLRDNVQETRANTRALADFRELVDGRLGRLEDRVSALEDRRRAGSPR